MACHTTPSNLLINSSASSSLAVHPSSPPTQSAQLAHQTQRRTQTASTAKIWGVPRLLDVCVVRAAIPLHATCADITTVRGIEDTLPCGARGGEAGSIRQWWWDPRSAVRSEGPVRSDGVLGGTDGGRRRISRRHGGEIQTGHLCDLPDRGLGRWVDSRPDPTALDGPTGGGAGSVLTVSHL